MHARGCAGAIVGVAGIVVAFRFPLEAVLRLRLSYERLEKLRLLAIAALIARLREEIAAATREESAARIVRRQILTEGAAAGELQLGVAAEKARARRNRELADRLTAFQRQHQRQSLAYQSARRRREILENLRARQLREYQREQDRKAQQALDELYLLRRSLSSQ